MLEYEPAYEMELFTVAYNENQTIMTMDSTGKVVSTYPNQGEFAPISMEEKQSQAAVSSYPIARISMS